MSQENVEMVRGFFSAFNAGDMDAVRETLDPDVVIARELEEWPETGPFVGREAVMRQWGRSIEALPGGTLELISVIDVGDRVVARQVAHARGQGPELNLEFTVISTIRNGRTLIIEYFWDYAEALASLGLSEQDAHS
jgi:ketosteroid isomerase-like protein